MMLTQTIFGENNNNNDDGDDDDYDDLDHATRDDDASNC